MLEELQSFRWHKGLHYNNSFFCEGPEDQCAPTGRHSWTIAGIHSAPYTQLCSDRLTERDKAKPLSRCLINTGMKDSPVNALSIRSHLLLAKPCKTHWPYCEANQASQFSVDRRAQATNTGCHASSSDKTLVEVVPRLVEVCVRRLLPLPPGGGWGPQEEKQRLQHSIQISRQSADSQHASMMPQSMSQGRSQSPHSSDAQQQQKHESSPAQEPQVAQSSTMLHRVRNSQKRQARIQ